MFALTINDVRRLAFEIATKNNIPHNFNKTDKMAGKKWFYGFKARNPQISLRGPQSPPRWLEPEGLIKKTFQIFQHFN